MGVKIHEDTLNYIDDLKMVIEINELQQYEELLSHEDIQDVETLCLMVRRDLEEFLVEPDDIHMFLKIIGAFINQNPDLAVYQNPHVARRLWYTKQNGRNTIFFEYKLEKKYVIGM